MADIVNVYPNSGRTYTTEGMFFGMPDANDEKPEAHGLETFYEDVHGICERLKQETFIVCGRKGCGKTAFRRFIEDEAKNNELIHYSNFPPKDYELEKLVQRVDDQVADKYKILYEWIILVKFTEMITEVNRYSSADAIVDLDKFWKINSGHLNITQRLLDSSESEINKGLELGFWDKLALTLSKKFLNVYKRPNFYDLIKDLKKKVITALNYQLHENHVFYLFFDDLDEDADLTNKEHCKKLIALIETAKNFNTEYLSGSAGKVVILLREDHVNKLSGHSTSFTKIKEGGRYTLNWYNPNADNSDESKLMLRKFVNKRLKTNFEKLGIPMSHPNDPWKDFVDERPNDAYNYVSAFQYILGFTQCRPRDFVYLFNNISDKNFRLPLDPDAIKKLLIDYIGVEFSELNDELVNVLPEPNIKSTFNKLILKLNESDDLSHRQVINRINDCELSTPEHYLNILIDYNILIPTRDGKSYPHYLYPTLTGNKKHYRYEIAKWIKAYYDNEVIC